MKVNEAEPVDVLPRHPLAADDDVASPAGPALELDALLLGPVGAQHALRVVTDDRRERAGVLEQLRHDGCPPTATPARAITTAA